MKDSTLGGYLHEHERPPAFQASDGYAYTVEIIADEAPAEAGAWKAYLFFVRWRGNEAVGHLETDYLSEAGSAAQARAPIERLTLHEIKTILDGLLSR